MRIGRDQAGPYAHSVQNDETHPYQGKAAKPINWTYAIEELEQKLGCLNGAAARHAAEGDNEALELTYSCYRWKPNPFRIALTKDA